MVSIQKKLTPQNFSKMARKKNLYIVIHYVGGVSSAKNNVDFYAREKLSASAHYFVDEKSIWQCVEDENKAWHCGGGLQGSGGHTFYKKCTNSNSIGIEMCCRKTSSGKWYFNKKTVENTVDLTRYLMEKYDILPERVIRHFDVTGKVCPEPYVTDEKAWESFKKMLDMEELTVTQYEELKALISDLSKEIREIKNPMIYNYVDKNMPDWAKKSVQKAIDKGIVKGDENGLNLTYSDLRAIVREDRAGLFD